MNAVDDHITILAASENLHKAVCRLRKEIYKADLYAGDFVAISIALACVEGVDDYLLEKANVIAETQP